MSSLVSQFLTNSMQVELGSLVTATGFTLEKALRSGLLNHDSSIGLYAGDAESYELFEPLFQPIIECYHGVERHALDADFSQIECENLDPSSRYIKSTRIRLARNIAGFPFANNLTAEKRLQLEMLVQRAFVSLSGEFAGSYVSFAGLDEEQQAYLQQQGLLFARGDRFQEAAGFNEDYPLGRGVFFTGDHSFRVWHGEEDHLRVISQEASADIAAVFSHLGNGLQRLAEVLEFSRNHRYGFLASCPTNIGTTMRAGVHICLPQLSQREELLRQLAQKHQLQIRGGAGEKSAVEGALYDLSNKRRLGVSERELVLGLHSALAEIIALEQSLE